MSAVRGFWIHLDADVLDDEIMPAVGPAAMLLEILRIFLNSPGGPWGDAWEAP